MQELVATADKEKNNKGHFHCKFCERDFHREQSFVLHVCEKKRRTKIQNEKQSQLGFMAWRQFYNQFTQSAKDRSFQEFIDSQYYGAFIRFASWCLDNDVIEFDCYLRFLVKNNKKIDQWTRESFYKEFLVFHIRNEQPIDALERAIKFIQVWSDKESTQFSDYFNCSSNQLVSNILSGKISPWVIYNIDSGQNAISRLDSEQLQCVWEFIDPPYWQKKIKENTAEVKLIKDILEEAKL